MTSELVVRVGHHLRGIVRPNPRRPTSVLVVAAHPVAESYSAAVRDRAVGALTVDGHDVDVIDLYRTPPPGGATSGTPFAEGLPATDDTFVQEMRAKLGAAKVLVLVHPTWWSGPPAALVAWYEAVLDPARPRVRSVRRVIVLTTHGSPKWLNVLQGEGGRLVAHRALRTVLHPLVRVRWVALYGMDRCAEADRLGFLDRVERAMHLL